MCTDNTGYARRKLTSQLSATLSGGYEAAAQKQIESFRKAQKIVSKNPLVVGTSESAQNLNKMPLSSQIDRLSRLQTQFQSHKTASRKTTSQTQKSSFIVSQQRTKTNNTTSGMAKTGKSASKETLGSTQKQQANLQGMISSGLTMQGGNSMMQMTPLTGGVSQTGSQPQSVVMNQLALKQHSNLFGGLSRHVLAAAKNQQVPAQIHTSSQQNRLVLQHSLSANKLVQGTTNSAEKNKMSSSQLGLDKEQTEERASFSQLAQKVTRQQNQTKTLDFIPQQSVQNEPNHQATGIGSGQKMSRSFIAVDMMNQEQNRLRKVDSANNIQTKTYLQQLKSNYQTQQIQSKQINSQNQTQAKKSTVGVLNGHKSTRQDYIQSQKKVALLNPPQKMTKSAQKQTKPLQQENNNVSKRSHVTTTDHQITSSFTNQRTDSPKIITIGGEGTVEDFRPSMVQVEAHPKKEVQTIPSSLALMQKIHSAPAQRQGPPRPVSQNAHPFKKVEDSATPIQHNLVRPPSQSISGAVTQTFARAKLLQQQLIQNKQPQKYDTITSSTPQSFIKSEKDSNQAVLGAIKPQNLQEADVHRHHQITPQNLEDQRVSSSPPEGNIARRQAELIGAENVEQDSSERPSILEKQTPELTTPMTNMEPISNFNDLAATSTDQPQTQQDLNVPPKIDTISPTQIHIKIDEEAKNDTDNEEKERKPPLKTENKIIQTEQIEVESIQKKPIEPQNDPPPIVTADKAISVSICCHERSKQIAVLQQHVEMLEEQRRGDAEKGKLKEKQYDGIIEALKKSMEDARIAAQRSQISSTAPSSEVFGVDELGKLLRESKEREHQLGEQLLDAQIEAERAQMKLQNQIQAKEDALNEVKLEVRLREQDLRQAQSMNERLREDLAMRILEALDEQAERLAQEKQSDLDQVNRQHHTTLKTLGETHSGEVKQLRELLYRQERKQREAEQQVLQLEIQLASAKQDAGVRFNDSELEEIRQENEMDFQMRAQKLQRIYEEQVAGLTHATDQIEALQLQKEAAEQGMMLLDEKVAEMGGEMERLKILNRRQKDREGDLVASHRVQLMRERKAADTASRKLMSQAKLESELNKKQITINQLKAQIKQLEMDDMHSQKILLMKRKQIEDEKTLLRKKQASTVRSLTRQNLSATRLKQQLEVKEAAISTERESKRALLIEKQKLEQEIKVIKRDKSYAGGDQSSRHNESMSMYFAKSQMFSPAVGQRNREDKSRSFLARGHQSARQIFMSQERLAGQQLSEQSQRNSEKRVRRGGGEEQGTAVDQAESISNESLVNIMEFAEQSEYQTSPEYTDMDNTGRKSGGGINPRPSKFSALDNFKSPDALMRKSVQAGMLTTRELQTRKQDIEDVRNEQPKHQIPLTARSQVPQERLFFKKAKLVKSSEKKDKSSALKFILKGLEGKKIRVGSGNRLRNNSGDPKTASANIFSMSRRSGENLRLKQPPNVENDKNSESENCDTKGIAYVSATDELQSFTQAATLPKTMRESNNHRELQKDAHFATQKAGSNKKLLLQIKAASRKASDKDQQAGENRRNESSKSPILVAKSKMTAKIDSQRISHDKDALVKSLIEARRKCESVRNLGPTRPKGGINSIVKQNWVQKEALQSEFRTQAQNQD